MTARVFRDAKYLETMVEQLGEESSTPTTSLTKGQVELLVQKGLLKAAEEHTVRAWCSAFPLPEHHKKRRRLITEPSLNKVCLDQGAMQLASVEQVIEGVARTATATLLDFPWFYGQVTIEDDCQAYYGVKTAFGTFVLTTVPTGSRQCPALAHQLTHSLVIKTVRQFEKPNIVVLGDAYIDNIRFCGPPAVVIAMMQWFKDETRKVGITLNAEDNDMAVAMSTYDFLGIQCFHDNANPAVALTQKTLAKLDCMLFRNEVNLEVTPQLFTLRDLLQMMGLLVWCSRILKIHMAPFYYFFKFVRRRVVKPDRWQLDAPAEVWQ